MVWGNRVFLTTVVEGGKAEPPQKGFFMGGKGPGREREMPMESHLPGSDSGKMLWEQTVHEGTPPGPTHAKISYASETPVTDGERVYAYFGNVGVFCFDFEGNPVWSKPIEPHTMKSGWAPPLRPCCTSTGFISPTTIKRSPICWR